MNNNIAISLQSLDMLKGRTYKVVPHGTVRYIAQRRNVVLGGEWNSLLSDGSYDGAVRTIQREVDSNCWDGRRCWVSEYDYRVIEHTV